MELINLTIPYAFLCEHSPPTWQSVRFGLQNGLIDPEVPRQLAVDQLGLIEPSPQALLEIACSNRNDLIEGALNCMADGEPKLSEGQLRDEWLYLVLAWTYTHRDEYLDPLQRVEEIYADFNYPQSIASFVRYMPLEGEDLGSREANERRLFDRWREYINE